MEKYFISHILCSSGWHCFYSLCEPLKASCYSHSIVYLQKKEEFGGFPRQSQAGGIIQYKIKSGEYGFLFKKICEYMWKKECYVLLT